MITMILLVFFDKLYKLFYTIYLMNIMNKSIIDNIVSWVLILGILILAFIVVKPIAVAMLIGVLLGYLLRPVEPKIRKLVKKKTISTLILIVLILALIIIPVVMFSPNIVTQVYELYGELKVIDIPKLISGIIPSLKDNTQMLYQIAVYYNEFIDKISGGLMDYFSNLITVLPNLFLQIFVCFFTFFFVVRDYEKFTKYISDLSPFPKNIKERLSGEFRSVTNAVIIGQVLVGIIQGGLMGIGFWILGFDNVLVLSLLSIIMGIIPIVGPWIVWVPVALFSLIQGNTTTALILVGYGFIFVSNIDNVIRPYLVSRSSNLPTVVTLIGTFGGLLAFGIPGLIVGPLILAYTLIIFDAYKNGDSSISELIKGDRNEVKNKKI